MSLPSADKGQKSLDAAAMDLLSSLRDAPKRFDIARCPVRAVAIGWELCTRDFARVEDGVIAITQAGLDYLTESASPNRTDPPFDPQTMPPKNR